MSSAPHTPMDINRETVVQLYFQSSLSRERRFHDDQPVKLLHPGYIYIPVASRWCSPGRAAKKRQKAEGKKIKESPVAKRRGRDIVVRCEASHPSSFPSSRLVSLSLFYRLYSWIKINRASRRRTLSAHVQVIL